MREYSHKSGIAHTSGSTPKEIFFYTGSDLDMIYSIDILLPLDTLGVLPVLLFLVSGSTLNTLIFIKQALPLPLTKNKPSGSTPRKIKVLGVLPECLMEAIYQDYISCQDHSQCTKIVSLGVLPEVLYHFCRSTPAKVVQHFVLSCEAQLNTCTYVLSVCPSVSKLNFSLWSLFDSL